MSTKIKGVAAVVFMSALYLLIRCMYAPIIWQGIPAYRYWIEDQTIIYRDTARVVLALIPILGFIFLPWWIVLLLVVWVFVLNWIIATVRIHNFKRKNWKDEE